MPNRPRRVGVVAFVVRDQSLLLERRADFGTWGVPGGALDEFETIEQGVVREVREETGLEAELIGPLDTIDYWFVWAPERTRYHKFVHYFLMRFAGGDFSQRDHEMEDAAWFEPDEARRRMAFANERRLLDLIPDVLATQDAGGS